MAIHSNSLLVVLPLVARLRRETGPIEWPLDSAGRNCNAASLGLYLLQCALRAEWNHEAQVFSDFACLHGVYLSVCASLARLRGHSRRVGHRQLRIQEYASARQSG